MTDEARPRPRPAPTVLPRPEWLRVRFTENEHYKDLKGMMRGLSLHTVCEEAHCPNVGECWAHRTATFMILGRICTRACRFCAVTTGVPTDVDPEEPLRVAEAAREMGLRHAVVTSVARDDLLDGGAGAFAATIQEIRRLNPGTTVEVLIPDFQGSADALRVVMDARPDILNHNVETVERLQRRVRAKAFYSRSLEVLRRAKAMAPGGLTKSGIMLGVGETWDEILGTLRDLRGVGCDIVTIGQYLRPSLTHLPIERYYTPEEFRALRDEGRKLGFRHVESGPLVRSSYHAHEGLEQAHH
jgi:lipoic acid synthetase